MTASEGFGERNRRERQSAALFVAGRTAPPQGFCSVAGTLRVPWQNDGTRSVPTTILAKRRCPSPNRSRVQSRKSARDPGGGDGSPGTHPAVKIIARSAWQKTVPIGGPAGQQDFLNGAIVLQTSLGPQELLAFLQQIEVQLGRQRTADGDRGRSIWICCCTTISS